MEKPNRPGQIGFFINAFLSICLTILQHKEFILIFYGTKVMMGPD